MIYTFVSDISDIDGAAARRELSDGPLYPHLDGGTPERVGAYLLLHRALKSVTGGEITEPIIREAGGRLRPSGSLSHISISLSHTDTLAACSISTDGKDVGVDIEREHEVKNKKKIYDRLLKNVNQNLQALEEKTHTLSLCEGACAKVAEDGFFTRWTRLEAMLKADGGGFGSLCKIADIIPAAKAESFLIKYKGQSYYLSIAAKEK